jgi:hypothetical protein
MSSPRMIYSTPAPQNCISMLSQLSRVHGTPSTAISISPSPPPPASAPALVRMGSAYVLALPKAPMAPQINLLVNAPMSSSPHALQLCAAPAAPSAQELNQEIVVSAQARRARLLEVYPMRPWDGRHIFQRQWTDEEMMQEIMHPSHFKELDSDEDGLASSGDESS